MSKSARRIWYHATSTHHGDRFVAAKRPPMLRSESEPLTPRICVSSMVAGCLTAVLFDCEAPVYVYRTVSKRRAYFPRREIWDALLTDEHWIWPPVEFALVGVIAPADVERVQEGVVEYLRKRKGASASLRCDQFVRAVAVLRGQFPSSRAEWWAEILSEASAKIVNTRLVSQSLQS